jgi:hypothetical protein
MAVGGRSLGAIGVVHYKQKGSDRGSRAASTQCPRNQTWACWPYDAARSESGFAVIIIGVIIITAAAIAADYGATGRAADLMLPLAALAFYQLE